jgi:nitrate/TMAO reductase-like tetraheme cytochrome c subunit
MGAFAKDLFGALNHKKIKISLLKIFLGALTASFFSLGLSDLILKYFNLNVLILIQFILGVLGFELFKRISTFKNLLEFLKIIKEMKDVFDKIRQDNKENVTNKKPANKKPVNKRKKKGD